MPRVPVKQLGTKLRPGWWLKVGRGLKVGQPFRLPGLPRRGGVSP